MQKKVPEGSNGFKKFPEDSRRLNKVQKGLHFFKNAQEPPKSFKNVLHLEGITCSWDYVYMKVQED